MVDKSVICVNWFSWKLTLKTTFMFNTVKQANVCSGYIVESKLDTNKYSVVQ